MSDIVTMNLANSGNYGAARRYDAIKYIVIHYTGNDGDTAAANGNYFARNVLQTSAHYFVDSNRIVQSVPDNRIAWHCGGKQYFHAECRNSNSIGVELCDDKRDGTVYPSKATIDRAVELTKALMAKYSIPQDHVVRHWDVTHKLCPAYWCGSPSKDALWQSAFLSKLKAPEPVPEPVKEEEEVTEQRYNSLVEIERDAAWAAPTIDKLIRSNALQGDGSGLDLSRDMLRILVILDRAGLYD